MQRTKLLKIMAQRGQGNQLLAAMDRVADVSKEVFNRKQLARNRLGANAQTTYDILSQYSNYPSWKSASTNWDYFQAGNRLPLEVIAWSKENNFTPQELLEALPPSYYPEKPNVMSYEEYASTSPTVSTNTQIATAPTGNTIGGNRVTTQSMPAEDMSTQQMAVNNNVQYRDPNLNQYFNVQGLANDSTSVNGNKYARSTIVTGNNKTGIMGPRIYDPSTF